MPNKRHCPSCGRQWGPYLVLNGWHPCSCGGHLYHYCRADNGGCGVTTYDPPLGERCEGAEVGFGKPQRSS